MTKEELKKKLQADPQAREQFLSDTANYYKSIGLGASHPDLAALKDKVAAKHGGVHPMSSIIITIID